MDRKQVKKEIRESMKGNFWYFALPVIFVVAISIASRVFDAFAANKRLDDDLRVIIIVWDIIATITWCLIFYPIRVSRTRMYIKFLQGEKPKIKELFEDVKVSFRILQQNTCLVVVFGAFILGVLCGIVPGVIVYCRYFLAPYIYADDPEALFTDVLRKSAEMMKGHYKELLKNCFSFWVWVILCFLTCGILCVYAEPYATLFNTKFYLELKEEYEDKKKLEKITIEKNPQIDKNNSMDSNPFV